MWWWMPWESGVQGYWESTCERQTGKVLAEHFSNQCQMYFCDDMNTCVNAVFYKMFSAGSYLLPHL